MSVGEGVISAANNILLGVDSENSERELTEAINKAKNELSNMLERYNVMRSTKQRAFTASHFNNVTAKYPCVGFGYTDSFLQMELEGFSLNYLIGKRQEIDRNKAIIFVGHPHNQGLVVFNKGGYVTLKNTSSIDRYDFPTERSRVVDMLHILAECNPEAVAGYNALREETKLVSPYFTNSGDISHPHAQGTRNNFSSICYGTNRWSEAYSRAKSIADYVDVLHRAALWFTSANLQDMYGSHSVPELCSNLRENAYPQAVRDLVEECFELVLTNLYKPVLEYASSGSDEDLMPRFESLATLLPLRRLCENIMFNHEGKTYLATTLIPFLRLIIMNDYSARTYNNTKFFARALNATYASWLLTFSHRLPYYKECMISDARYILTLHQWNFVSHSITQEMYSNMLCAPLALKDVVSTTPNYFNFI